MDDERTYTTARGVVVEFQPIATLLDALQSARLASAPKPPTYTVEIMGGRKEVHEHDAVSILDPSISDADRAAWAEYLAAKAAHDAEYNRKVSRLVLARGIKAPRPADDSWIEDQKWLGIVVPDDPRERWIHYLETEVMGGPDDYSAVMVGAFRVSGVPEELVSQIEAAFQRALGRGKRDAAGEPTLQEGELVVQPAP